jgi:hypothetical protein
MYAYETDDMEALSGLLEGLDSDESDDLTERNGRGRGRGRGSVQTPSRNPSYNPQSTMDPYVKKSELARSMMIVDAKVKTLSEAATKLSARVNTVADQQERQAMAIKKESAKHEKDIKDLCQKLELLTLLPLLTSPSTRTIDRDVDGLKKDDKVLIGGSDGFSSLLPILLLGGCGGGSGGGGLFGGGEGGSSNMLLPLLLLGGLGKK